MDQLTITGGQVAHGPTNFISGGSGFRPPGPETLDPTGRGWTAQGTITFNSLNFSSLDIQDNDDTFNDDQPANVQTIATAGSYVGHAEVWPFSPPVNLSAQVGWRVEGETAFILEDPSTGEEYVVTTPAINPNQPPNNAQSSHYLLGLAFVDKVPPAGVTLNIIVRQPLAYNQIPYSSLVSGVVCLTTGALVETASGPRAVENLSPGDAILTEDGTSQPLRLLLRRVVSQQDLQRNPNFVPVRITAGALGNGLPLRDLIVSREHRMLLRNSTTQLLTGSDKALVAAKNLISIPGIFPDHKIEQVEYLHLVFDNHEIIYAEGAETESLLLSPLVLRNQPPEALKELEALFGDQLHILQGEMPAAAHIPKTRIQALIAQHLTQ